MLLINPQTKTNKNIPNLALAYMGTISGSKIIDLNLSFKKKERFLEYKTDVLGISIQSRNFDEFEKIETLYRKKYPDTKIVSVAGIIDIQCCYPFLKTKENINFLEPFGDNLPFPNYELFDSFQILRKNWESGIWQYPIMTSQGCNYKCIYCSAKNRPIQTRSAQNCYEELNRAKNSYKIKSFQILDDCFNFNKQRIIEFCNKIKPLEMTWYCNNGLRINQFDESVAKTMADSGCKGISFGIESIDQGVLNNVQKGLSIDQIEKTLRIAKKYFKFVNGFFIIGLPGSTYKKDLKTLHWAIKREINAHFGYYLPEDQLINNDFYTDDAEPLSKEYPDKLQKRMFCLSSFMREKCSFLSIIKNIINIFKYDLLYLPFYFKFGFKKLVNKIL